MKEPKIEEAWDKKKIAVSLIILLGLIIAAVYFSGVYKIKSSVSSPPQPEIKKTVKGASESFNTTGVKEAIQKKVEEIKTEAENIDVIEVASSSPQVQKIINDIKSLKDYPSDQAKSMCEKVCDSF